MTKEQIIKDIFERLEQRVVVYKETNEQPYISASGFCAASSYKALRDQYYKPILNKSDSEDNDAK